MYHVCCFLCDDVVKDHFCDVLWVFLGDLMVNFIEDIYIYCVEDFVLDVEGFFDRVHGF